MVEIQEDILSMDQGLEVTTKEKDQMEDMQWVKLLDLHKAKEIMLQDQASMVEVQVHLIKRMVLASRVDMVEKEMLMMGQDQEHTTIQAIQICRTAQLTRWEEDTTTN